MTAGQVVWRRHWRPYLFSNSIPRADAGGAAHEKAHLDKAIAAFIKVGKALGIIKS
ncbi:MAG: hypothetical protein LBF39_03070 [Prevotellaceae bacterium]|nr:hypothetical protein [Prevotellaceae bacterium]